MTTELKQSEQNLLKGFRLLAQYENDDQIQRDHSFVNAIKAKLRKLALRLEAQKRKHTRNLANNKLLKKDEARALTKIREITALETYVEKLTQATDAEALFDNSSIRLPKPHYTPNSQLRNIRNHIKIIRDDIQKSELQKRKVALATAASIMDKSDDQQFDHLLAALRVREATYARRVSQGKEYEGFKTKNAISATEKLAATREMIAFVKQAKDDFAGQRIITEVTGNTFNKAATTGTLGKIASEVKKTINAIRKREEENRRIAALARNDASEAVNTPPASEAVSTPPASEAVSTPPVTQPKTSSTPRSGRGSPTFFSQAPEKTRQAFSDFLQLIRDNKEENKTFCDLQVTGNVPNDITEEDLSAMKEIRLRNVDFSQVPNLHAHVELLKSINLAGAGELNTVVFSEDAKATLADLNAAAAQALDW